MTVWIGTSGWQYAHWKNRFYPPETPQAGWLEFFAERFATVESNNAFYRLPERKTFEAWRARTPDDFLMAVKLSRYLTHIRRLREPAEPVERFMQRATGLGDKLGPVLIQLPPSLQSDVPRLAATLEQFPPGMRVAVEFRHETWYTAEVRRLLERHTAALCLAAAAACSRRSGIRRISATFASMRGGRRRGLATAGRRWRRGPSAWSGPTERAGTSTSISTTIPWPARCAMQSSLPAHVTGAASRPHACLKAPP